MRPGNTMEASMDLINDDASNHEGEILTADCVPVPPSMAAAVVAAAAANHGVMPSVDVADYPPPPPVAAPPAPAALLPTSASFSMKRARSFPAVAAAAAAASNPFGMLRSNESSAAAAAAADSSKGTMATTTSSSSNSTAAAGGNSTFSFQKGPSAKLASPFSLLQLRSKLQQEHQAQQAAAAAAAASTSNHSPTSSPLSSSVPVPTGGPTTATTAAMPPAHSFAASSSSKLHTSASMSNALALAANSNHNSSSLKRGAARPIGAAVGALASLVPSLPRPHKTSRAATGGGPNLLTMSLSSSNFAGSHHNSTSSGNLRRVNHHKSKHYHQQDDFYKDFLDTSNCASLLDNPLATPAPLVAAAPTPSNSNHSWKTPPAPRTRKKFGKSTSPKQQQTQWNTALNAASSTNNSNHSNSASKLSPAGGTLPRRATASGGLHTSSLASSSSQANATFAILHNAAAKTDRPAYGRHNSERHLGHKTTSSRSVESTASANSARPNVLLGYKNTSSRSMESTASTNSGRPSVHKTASYSSAVSKKTQTPSADGPTTTGGGDSTSSKKAPPPPADRPALASTSSSRSLLHHQPSSTSQESGLHHHHNNNTTMTTTAAAANSAGTAAGDLLRKSQQAYHYLHSEPTTTAAVAGEVRPSISAASTPKMSSRTKKIIPTTSTSTSPSTRPNLVGRGTPHSGNNTPTKLPVMNVLQLGDGNVMSIGMGIPLSPPPPPPPEEEYDSSDKDDEEEEHEDVDEDEDETSFASGSLPSSTHQQHVDEVPPPPPPPHIGDIDTDDEGSDNHYDSGDDDDSNDENHLLQNQIVPSRTGPHQHHPNVIFEQTEREDSEDLPSRVVVNDDDTLGETTIHEDVVRHDSRDILPEFVHTDAPSMSVSDREQSLNDRSYREDDDDDDDAYVEAELVHSLTSRSSRKRFQQQGRRVITPLRSRSDGDDPFQYERRGGGGGRDTRRRVAAPVLPKRSKSNDPNSMPPTKMDVVANIPTEISPTRHEGLSKVLISKKKTPSSHPLVSTQPQPPPPPSADEESVDDGIADIIIIHDNANQNHADQDDSNNDDSLMSTDWESLNVKMQASTSSLDKEQHKMTSSSNALDYVAVMAASNNGSPLSPARYSHLDKQGHINNLPAMTNSSTSQPPVASQINVKKQPPIPPPTVAQSIVKKQPPPPTPKQPPQPPQGLDIMTGIQRQPKRQLSFTARRSSLDNSISFQPGPERSKSFRRTSLDHTIEYSSATQRKGKRREEPASPTKTTTPVPAVEIPTKSPAGSKSLFDTIRSPPLHENSVSNLSGEYDETTITDEQEDSLHIEELGNISRPSDSKSSLDKDQHTKETRNVQRIPSGSQSYGKNSDVLMRNERNIAGLRRLPPRQPLSNNSHDKVTKGDSPRKKVGLSIFETIVASAPQQRKAAPEAKDGPSVEENKEKKKSSQPERHNQAKGHGLRLPPPRSSRTPDLQAEDKDAEDSDVGNVSNVESTSTTQGGSLFENILATASNRGTTRTRQSAHRRKEDEDESMAGQLSVGSGHSRAASSVRSARSGGLKSSLGLRMPPEKSPLLARMKETSKLPTHIGIKTKVSATGHNKGEDQDKSDKSAEATETNQNNGMNSARGRSRPLMGIKSNVGLRLPPPRSSKPKLTNTSLSSDNNNDMDKKATDDTPDLNETEAEQTVIATPVQGKAVSPSSMSETNVEDLTSPSFSTTRIDEHVPETGEDLAVLAEAQEIDPPYTSHRSLEQVSPSRLMNVSVPNRMTSTASSLSSHSQRVANVTAASGAIINGNRAKENQVNKLGNIVTVKKSEEEQSISSAGFEAAVIAEAVVVPQRQQPQKQLSANGFDYISTSFTTLTTQTTASTPSALLVETSALSTTASGRSTPLQRSSSHRQTSFRQRQQVQAPPPPKPSNSHMPTLNMQLEVEPGVFLRLRGSAETWMAVQTNRLQSVECVVCTSHLQCLETTTFVLCPVCRVVSPTPNPKRSRSNRARGTKGDVGLGVLSTEVQEWVRQQQSGLSQYNRY